MQSLACATQWVLGAVSPGVQWVVHEAVCLPTSNAMVKNEWSFISPPPVCRHSVLTRITLPFDLYLFTLEKLIIFVQIEFQILCQLLYVVGWHIGRSFTEKESIQGTNG